MIKIYNIGKTLGRRYEYLHSWNMAVEIKIQNISLDDAHQEIIYYMLHGFDADFTTWLNNRFHEINPDSVTLEKEEEPIYP